MTTTEKENTYINVRQILHSMDIGITRMSSKGQVVIPKEMRKHFKQGEKLLVLEEDGKIILRSAKDLDEKLADDLEFARRTEEAWKSYERGEFITMEAEEFFKELSK
jgi:AbrB family looped-hinge helix DNA binding protein